jgi:hypothetical protein
MNHFSMGYRRDAQQCGSESEFKAHQLGRESPNFTLQILPPAAREDKQGREYRL